MIEPMAKAYVAVRQEEREALLAALGTLGVLHLVPAGPEHGADEEEIADTLAKTRRALRLLDGLTPAGKAPAGPVSELVAEALALQEREEELKTRLAALRREARDAAVWGSVTRARIEELASRGVPVRVVEVADDDVAALPGTVVPVRSLGKGRSLVMLLGDVETPLPPRAVSLTPPERGLPSIESERAGVRAELASEAERLAELARRSGDVSAEVTAVEDRLSLTRALHGGLDGASLFGVQGWLPEARAGSLAADLEAAGMQAAVYVRPAAEDENPPTLVRYPRALRPIRALFDLLGVRPGYDEIDPTSFFMVAVPLFAGMLIADAGYGLVFVLGALYLRRRLRDKVGADAPNLIMLFGGTALVWGAISGSWFGVTPASMVGAGGWVSGLGGALDHLQLIRGSAQEARDTLIKVCFLLGSVHLILAHLRRVVALAPDASALADVGWCGVLAAMLALIWNLFFRDAPLPAGPTHVLYDAGGVGFAFVALFAAPASNPLVRVAKGVAGGLFPLIGAFGDTLSYIRLAAVGLASFYLAVAIDTLAGQAAAAGTWAVGIPILLVGHSLNMMLSLVAILAHGVRLNLLEFSNHSGLQWAGYAYRPFAARTAKEH